MVSRRGSTIAEAALVLPLVILSVITCILICMFCYSQTQQQCLMHMSLREHAGQVTEKTTYLSSGSEWSGSIEIDRQGIFPSVKGREAVIMNNPLLLRNRVDVTLEGLWHATDGVNYVRHCHLAGKLADRR